MHNGFIKGVSGVGYNLQSNKFYHCNKKGARIKQLQRGTIFKVGVLILQITTYKATNFTTAKIVGKKQLQRGTVFKVGVLIMQITTYKAINFTIAKIMGKKQLKG